jgi:hypothetical protein
MTDDLKTRLRWGCLKKEDSTIYFVNPDGPEAALRIEKLEAALREIASIDSYYVSDIVDFARKALEGKDD